MRHLSEEDLILHHYGEARDAQMFAQHLAACPSCRSRMEDLKSMLALMAAAEIPERGASYGAEVWEKLRPRLPQRRIGFASFLLHPSRWAIAGAMAVLVIGAFLLGRLWHGPSSLPADAGPVVAAQQARERILLTSVDDHLERSQRLLMEIVNAPGSESLDISQQRTWAEDLIESNRLYRQTAVQVGEVGIASVLEELERMLMEIAHSPAAMSAAELRTIQERIDSEGTLFKVRVLGSQVREREKAASRELARRTS